VFEFCHLEEGRANHLDEAEDVSTSGALETGWASDSMTMGVLHPKENEASPRLHKSCERRRSDHLSSLTTKQRFLGNWREILTWLSGRSGSAPRPHCTLSNFTGPADMS
jgi:hypothetical protein